jgi:gamma-glutamyl hydrolase
MRILNLWSLIIYSLSAFDYPIYGSQWHPEKNSYEMGYTRHVTHTFESVLVAQYFANFFVDEGERQL